MQGQHGGKGAVVVRDKQGPAPFNLPRDARAQLRQKEITRVFQAGRDPAFHPDPSDRVILVGPRRTNEWRYRASFDLRHAGHAVCATSLFKANRTEINLTVWTSRWRRCHPQRVGVMMLNAASQRGEDLDMTKELSAEFIGTF